MKKQVLQAFLVQTWVQTSAFASVHGYWQRDAELCTDFQDNSLLDSPDRWAHL